MSNRIEVPKDFVLKKEDLPYLFTPEELSKRLPFTEGSLANRRAKGQGPSYLKVGGKVMYPADDVSAFENSGKQE